MIKYKVLIFVFTAASFLSACATQTRSPDLGVELIEIIQQLDVVSFPLKKSEYGRWIVPLTINDEYEAEMVIDTGATYSALFETSVEKFNLIESPDKTIRVHGLITNANTMTTLVNSLRFGNEFLGSKSFAILPSDDEQDEKFEAYDGVIGMEVLERYRLYIDGSEKRIYFIPRSSRLIQKPNHYVEVDLYQNPYSELAPSLHFFDLSVKNKNIPSLLDTGTDVHVINWHAATFVEAKSLRARLKWQWELAGAVGEFKPVVAAKMRSLKSGRYKWEDTIMLIKDTDSLSFIGVDDKPFVVAGVNLLGDRDVFLDFDANKMWLQPR
ncbi:MAG: retropepsin-like aspartic protease [Maricaulaceae bacterium]